MSVKDMLLLQKSKDMVDSTDEKRLLAELGAGSFQAFEKLYHRYSGKLYNFIMRISAATGIWLKKWCSPPLSVYGRYAEQ